MPLVKRAGLSEALDKKLFFPIFPLPPGSSRFPRFPMFLDTLLSPISRLLAFATLLPWAHFYCHCAYSFITVRLNSAKLTFFFPSFLLILLPFAFSFSTLYLRLPLLPLFRLVPFQDLVSSIFLANWSPFKSVSIHAYASMKRCNNNLLFLISASSMPVTGINVENEGGFIGRLLMRLFNSSAC